MYCPTIFKPTLLPTNSRMQNINTSLICLTFNRLNNFKRHWEEVIEPVLKEHEDVEAIIVDNGSNEAGKDEYILKVIQPYPTVTLIKVAQNRGIAPGKNLGLRLARGKKYRVMLEDDYFFIQPSWFNDAVELLKNPEVGVVNWSLYLHNGDRYEPIGEKKMIGNQELEVPKRVCLGPWMTRLEIYHQVGTYDVAAGPYGANDLDMWHRFSKVTNIVFAPGGWTTPEIKPEHSCLTDTEENNTIRSISREENIKRLQEKLHLPEAGQWIRYDEYERV